MTLKSWESLTNKITEQFIIKYFNLEEDEELDYCWIGDDVGSVLSFADYFISFSDIKLCLEKDIPIDKFFSWYDWCLEHHPEYINLQHFVWGAAEIKKKEREHLKLLKKRVKLAEEELKKYINDSTLL